MAYPFCPPPRACAGASAKSAWAGAIRALAGWGNTNSTERTCLLFLLYLTLAEFDDTSSKMMPVLAVPSLLPMVRAHIFW